MKKNERNKTGMNVGTSLILVAFVLLCLVAFAALSFSSARSDLTLTQQIASRQVTYYDACSKAEDKLTQISATLYELEKSGQSETDYFQKIINTYSSDSEVFIEEKNEQTILSFCIPMGATEELLVELLPIYSPNTSHEAFNILVYRTRHLEGDEEDDNIINGLIFE